MTQTKAKKVVFLLTAEAYFSSGVSEVLFKPQARAPDGVCELMGLPACS